MADDEQVKRNKLFFIGTSETQHDLNILALDDSAGQRAFGSDQAELG